MAFHPYDNADVQGPYAHVQPMVLPRVGWKWQRPRVSRHTDGHKGAAFERGAFSTFVMPIDQDMCFRICDQAGHPLIPRYEGRPVHAESGHPGLFVVAPGERLGQPA